MRVAGHHEVLPLRGRAFRSWLARCYYEAEKGTPGAQALADATNVLEGQAVHDGPEAPVYVRLAQHEDAIYLDLADPDWRVVEITKDGWRVITDPPVHFRRPGGIKTLPAPQEGTIEPLRGLLNVAPEGWQLFIAWLLAALRPNGPYPILVLHGEQGSAKSTASRIARALIDPNAAALRARPKNGHDLMIAATNGWVIALDNLSSIQPRESDALCRLSTGGGFATRTLYENGEETIFEAQRPVILNGIGDIATRSDLLDRALVLELPPIRKLSAGPSASCRGTSTKKHRGFSVPCSTLL